MDILQGIPEGTEAEQLQLFNYLCLGRAGFLLNFSCVFPVFQGISAAFFSPSRYSLCYQLHPSPSKKLIDAGSCPPCMGSLCAEQDKLGWPGSFTPPETTSP